MNTRRMITNSAPASAMPIQNQSIGAPVVKCEYSSHAPRPRKPGTGHRRHQMIGRFGLSSFTGKPVVSEPNQVRVAEQLAHFIGQFFRVRARVDGLDAQQLLYVLAADFVICGRA